ncbi:hypothetical protein GCM10008959_20580 [Deinococcus seoulensis]|uniref:VWFA domain-containing protein n=1 Tax=Deinococcus seoulensis TaxID=1837379 RepID=A0ABQ2RRL0_9DEIO|nr:VWA domain-containing protein [Deinococcus seoulensis]GGR58746.1 hypothetical protein GCM10008959_20580 [Deinococcus seoulensis]
MRRTTLMILPALLLSACGGPSGPPSPSEPVAATSGTINGTRVLAQGTYQFSFTPKDGETVTGSAQIAKAEVRNLSQGKANVKVCGNVKTNGDLTATLTLDATGSMSWNDPDERRRQAGHAFAKRMRKQDMGAVLSFDSTTQPSAGLRASYLWQDFTGNQGQMTSAVNHATFVGGNTPLYDAIMDASDLLKATGKTNTRILILTDGEDNASVTTTAQAIEYANQNRTPVYIVGLDVTGKVDFTVAEDIASQTGGLFQQTNDPSELTGMFDKLFNSAEAEGCLELNFTETPPAGTVVTGELAITLKDNGKKDSTVVTPFTVTVR